MKSIVFTVFSCLAGLFLSSCVNSRTGEQLPDSDADFYVDEETINDAEIIDLVCSSKEIEIEIQDPIKTESTGVVFFSGKSEDFFILDKTEQTWTVFHYSESMEVLSQFSVDNPLMEIDHISHKILNVEDDSIIIYFENKKYEKWLSSIKKAKKTDLQIYTGEVAFNNALVEVYDTNAGEISFYDENLELQNTVIYEKPEENSYGIARYCNEKVYLFFAVENSIYGYVIENDNTANYFKGEEISVEFNIKFDLFKCYEDEAVAVINVEKTYFESYRVDNESHIFRFKSDGSFQTTADVPEVIIDIVPSDDLSVNIVYQSSKNMFVRSFDLSDDSNSKDISSLSFLHYINGAQSFINGSGHFFLIDLAIYPYIVIFENDGRLISENALYLYRKDKLETGGFFYDKDNEQLFINGSITYSFGDQENKGLYDIFTGRLLFDEDSYEIKISGTSRDESGKEIIKTDSGYVAVYKSILPAGSENTYELKLSFLNEDLSEIISHSFKTKKDFTHFIKKNEKVVELWFFDDKTSVHRFDQSGSAGSVSSWEKQISFNQLNDIVLSPDKKSYVVSYHVHIEGDLHCDVFNFPVRYDKLYLLTLPVDPVDEGKVFNFGEYNSFARKGGTLFDSDGTLYAAFSTVDPMWLACGSSDENPEAGFDQPSIVFGYFDEKGLFKKTTQKDTENLCDVSAHEQTGNVYVFCDKSLEIYSKTGILLSKRTYEKKKNWIINETGDLLNIDINISEENQKITLEECL
ncbi:MAG TPA: hypothetical protein P5044_00800 [bacterium]|nr:hypothetical protein [bacterium]